MDQTEKAVRILARALGHGRAWEARVTYGTDNWQPSGEDTPEVSLGGTWEEDEPAATSDGLPVCRETETVERAGHSVSAWLGRPDAQRLTQEQRMARSKLTPEEQKTLWAWEAANPLTKGQAHNARRPRELEHWQRTRSGPGVRIARPMHKMDQCAIEALASIAKPLQSAWLLFVVQDGRYWSDVERHARAVLPPEAHDGIAEGMYRLLMNPAKRARAKELTMRETDWDAMSQPALCLFEEWVGRAARAFLQSLEPPKPASGRQSSAHRVETWWKPPAEPAPVHLIELSALDRGGPPASPRA